MDQTAIIAAVGVPIASALIAIGVWLGKRDDKTKPPPMQPQPSVPSLPTLATTADVEAVRRLADEAKRLAEEAVRAASAAARAAEGAQSAAAAAKQATDGMLPRLDRAEQDVQEHDGILRTVEVNVGRLGERLKVKLEDRDGKRSSG